MNGLKFVFLVFVFIIVLYREVEQVIMFVWVFFGVKEIVVVFDWIFWLVGMFVESKNVVFFRCLSGQCGGQWVLQVVIV